MTELLELEKFEDFDLPEFIFPDAIDFPEIFPFPEMCEASTQTESFKTCIVKKCQNWGDPRCGKHEGVQDVEFKSKVKICQMRHCKVEALKFHRCCLEHERLIGNVAGVVNYDYDYVFKRCVVLKCYRRAEIGWRCNKHYGSDKIKFKHCKLQCNKKKCKREVYKQGYLMCKNHL